MIVNYIDIELSSSVREDFNKAVAIAISAAKSNLYVMSKVRIMTHDDSDKIELFNAFYEYNEKTREDDFKVMYFTERMKSFGIVIPSSNDTNSYVYVVSWDKVWDGEVIVKDNKVFTSTDDAFKFYMEFKENEIDSAQEKGVSNDWAESDDNYQDFDCGNAVWEYYKKYDYSNYHSCIYMDKREIL